MKDGRSAERPLSDGSTELTTAVDALQRHRSIFSSRVCDLILHGYLGQHPGVPVAAIPPRLTLREREIVQLVGESKTSKEIAAMLGMSLKTAETHGSNSMIKLNRHSIVELVLYAVRIELLRL